MSRSESRSTRLLVPVDIGARRSLRGIFLVQQLDNKIWSVRAQDRPIRHPEEMCLRIGHLDDTV
jgi:hypothetical protein